ncbi:MAG: DUF6345 domain-containing protein [Candidatus Thorarchaeota archaeon]
MIDLNRNVIFIVLFIFVLSGIPTDVPDTNVTISFEKPNYVLSQTEMPIYELITPDVNQSYVQDMARSLFVLSDTVAEENEGVFFVNRGTESFEMDTKDGSMWYADYSKIWNVSLGIEVPTAESCRTTADAWLREKGILPSAASFVSVGTTNATTYTPDGEAYASKILQYNVNYEFTLGDYPIAGDAAQITVMIGEGGDTVGFDWKWREPKAEPYGSYELIEYESVLEVNGINPEHVVDHRLVYTTDEDPDTHNFLYPVYEIELLEPDVTDDIPIDIHNIMILDSTFFKPKVEITIPSSSISVMPGTAISFDCEVQLGTPPYTYEWGSDFDGVLSTSKSFTTQSLSELLKSDTPVPHAISVRVRDHENRGASDCIAVTIETVDFNPNPTITVGAVALVAFIGIGLFVLRRRKIAPILFFLIMMFSAFMLFPVADATSGIPSTPKFVPSAPTGAYDDGVKEIGIEWVGMSHSKPLWNTETNIEGWYNKMGTTGGYSREFNWGEYSAWEEDFKDSSFSGTDTTWVDAVDFVYYQDHGGPNGVAFTSNHDDKGLHYIQMRLGDGDLDSIVFDACSPLAWMSKEGDNVFERWSPSLQGIHQICSFATTSQNSKTRGTKFATYMTDLGMTIISAWFRATMETEGADRLGAVFYGSKSSNPLNPQLDDPINDHAYGFGYVCTDPIPGSFGHYVYITNNC